MNVDLLKRVLCGNVLQPGDPGYGEAVRIDNGRVKRTPALIVFPATPTTSPRHCASSVTTVSG